MARCVVTGGGGFIGAYLVWFTTDAKSKGWIS